MLQTNFTINRIAFSLYGNAAPNTFKHSLVMFIVYQQCELIDNCCKRNKRRATCCFSIYKRYINITIRQTGPMEWHSNGKLSDCVPVSFLLVRAERLFCIHGLCGIVFVLRRVSPCAIAFSVAAARGDDVNCLCVVVVSDCHGLLCFAAIRLTNETTALAF